MVRKHYPDNVDKIDLEELEMRFQMIQYEKLENSILYCQTEEQLQNIQRELERMYREVFGIEKSKDEIFKERIARAEKMGLLNKTGQKGGEIQ